MSTSLRTSIFSVTDHYPDLPRSIGQFYHQVLNEIEYAEQLGFANYFVAEHHFHEYGVVTSPPVLLGAAARTTKRIGLGVAVAVLPFHHPLTLAEDYAMVDQLSGGRLALGVGSGYLQHEYDGFNMGPWEKRARFDEALEMMERGWLGKPFDHHGYYHHASDVRLAVTPTKVKPPTWVAVIRPEAAYHVGRQGRDIMLIPYATADDINDLGEIISEYRRGRSEVGYEGEGDVAVALHTYIGEGDEVYGEVGEPFERYVDTRLYAKSHRSYREVDAAGLVLFGNQDSTREHIDRIEQLGVTHLMALCNFGAMEPDLVRGSMERLARMTV